MSPFPIDPADPYPHRPELTDAQAMAYSAAVDEWLGFEIEQVERRVAARVGTSRLGDPQEYWVGLAIQSLLTPYTEIRELLERLELRAGERLIDLGAGYGRIG